MGRISKLLVAAAPIFYLSATLPSYGFVLKNNDTEAYVVEIIEDHAPDTTHEIELKQGEVIRDLCSEGCLVRINGEEYSFFGSEEMVVEGGELLETIQ